MQKHTTSPEETRACAARCAARLQPGTCLCLSGDLGAGKTTFTQGILAALGAEGPFTSPTFTIVRTYRLAHPTSTGIVTIYHIDPYRITESDLPQIGWTEIRADHTGIIVVEWPEKIANAIPSDACMITITHCSPTARDIIFSETCLCGDLV